MKPIPTRMRILGGLAVAAGLFWGVDYFTGGGPKPASAASTAATPTAPAADWEETTALILRLTSDAYVPVEPDLAALPRDLFAGASVRPDEPEAGAGSAEAAESDPVAEFQAAHRLVGVMLGQRPLAVIDERVVPLDAEVDGFRLVQVARDFIVLRRPDTGVQVRLELQARPKNAARGGS